MKKQQFGSIRMEHIYLNMSTAMAAFISLNNQIRTLNNYLHSLEGELHEHTFDDAMQSVCVDEIAAVNGYKSSNRKLAENFVRLVNEHVKDEHTVNYYAGRLCVSAHHLSMVVKKETGNAAKEWIARTLTARIQAALRFDDRPLKELADDFCFASTSSLCKFFKQRTGTTAFSYRLDETSPINYVSV